MMHRLGSMPFGLVRLISCAQQSIIALELGTGHPSWDRIQVWVAFV